MEGVVAARAKGEPTVPSTIGLEKKTNPFLRPTRRSCATRSVWKRQRGRRVRETRKRKDNF